jgi:hypothetical protein
MKGFRLHPILVCILLWACVASEPAGQFGVYHEHNKRIYLPDGDTLTVYRVKLWEFKDGSPPALQLEYASPVPLSDTVALRRLAERIWPAFVPYVEEARVTTAILTATQLEKVGGPGAWAARTHSFGIVAEHDTGSVWRVRHSRELLPSREQGGKGRIAEADGRPLVLSSHGGGT